MNRSPAFFASAALFAIAAPARAETTDIQDLGELSIEELAQLPVRSASKREEPLSSAAAALYVITAEEIRQSPATSLPEVLRLAPNLQVQQADASQYAISARGFNGLESGNKLLALIDGRTIYTPLASSIFWNLHSPLLEDIQQIEVISGPGGTLFGPNAVNGVINITTFDAQETIGTMARGTVGADERTAALRHGFALGGAGAVRVYANWHDRDGLPAGIAGPRDDAWQGWQAGFRSDFVTDEDHFTLQGDLFDADAASSDGDGADGHNLLARWSRTLSPSSSLQFQAYYDRFEREFTLVKDSLETVDGEAQFNINRGAHELVVGSGVRTTKDEFVNNLNAFQLDPPSRRLWVYNIFAQDRIALTSELALIAGMKVERSTFTGWQLLPNVEIAWNPDPAMLLWAGVSRAVRTPSRIDRELTLPGFLGKGIDFDSEKLVAVEAGYRGQPASNINLSVSGFLNFYDDIRTTEFTGELDGEPYFPIRLRNGLKGKSYGVEAWGTAQMTPWWRLALGTATLWKDFHYKDGVLDLAQGDSLGNDPSWQVKAQSYFDLTPKLQLTVNARAVDDIERDPAIDGYVEAGARLGYLVTDTLELYVAGRNLLHRDHAENNDANQGQLAERSVYVGTRVRF